MPIVYMLIGLPASGKSTWRDQATRVYSALIASSDDYIESMAKSEGKTYNEAFKENIKGAEKHVKAQVNYAIQNDINLIWDQTNLTPDTRKARLAFFPTHWVKVAVVVECADFDEWKRRLMNRPGKIIPAPTIENMMKSFVPPVLEEGFHEIVEIVT